MPEPLNADESRQATTTIRAYRYQILRTIYEWLQLGSEEILYVERAEDYDRASDSGDHTFQVKDTKGSGSVTLRASSVVDAINNYWKLREANPRRTIRFHLVTTSPIGVEAGNPFGQGRPGLGVWEKARLARNPRDGDQLTTEIRDFLIKEGKLDHPVLTFLGAESVSNIRSQLVDSIAWHASEPSGKEVEEAIRRKLQTICWERNTATNYAEKILAQLERHTWTVASSHTDRALTIEDFYRLFEDATLVSIPQSGLANLMHGAPNTGALGALALGGSAEDLGQALAIVIGGATRLGSTPPLSGSVIPRRNITDALVGIVSEQPVLYVQGSTGSGKTTQAAILTQYLGDEWLWVSCRDADEIQLRTALVGVGRWLDKRQTRRYLVLDDIDVQKHLGTLESILPSLLYTVRERKGVIVVTSHHPFPQRLRLSVNAPENVSFSVPPFSESEIGDYLLPVGLIDNQLREAWAKIIWLRTSGHPQLVVAHAANLRQRKFPKFEPKDLLETPREIKEAQDEARLLLSKDLPVAQRDLLYRLSLLTGPFTRQRGLAIAGIVPAIPTPGDIFDLLVGPWIERVDADLYRMSPLIQSAGRNANGESWAKQMHGSIAGAWAMFRDQTPWGLAAILFHAVMGENGSAVQRIAIGLFDAEEKIWEAVAAADAVFSYVYVESGQTFPYANPFQIGCARLLQFKLAARNRPEVCIQILDRIEEEFPLDSKVLPVKMMRQILLSLVVVHPKVPLPIRRVVAAITQVIQIADALPSKARGVSLHVPSPDEIFDKGGKFDVAPGLGLALIQRVSSIEDLRDAISALEAMDPVVRARCLRLFRIETDMGRQLSDSVWLTEHQSLNPRWRELADVLGLLFSRAIEWGESELASGVSSVRARTLDENLNDAKGALASLSDALQHCGSSYLLLDAKAKILSDQREEREALAIWKETLEVWQADKRANKVGLAQALRRAAVAAAKSDCWSDAANYFQRAAEVLKGSENQQFAIGLFADSGYAHWRAGNPDQAVGQMFEALSGLETVQNSPDNLRDYFLHKVIGHVMTWVATSANQAAQKVEEPLPGCCSHVDPSEEIMKLHITPIDFSWENLVNLNHATRMDRADIEAHATILRDSQYPGVRMLIAQHQIDRLLERGDVLEVVKRIADLVEALATLQMQKSSTAEIWEPAPRVIDLSLNLSTSEKDFWLYYLCKSLMSIAGRQLQVKDVVREWRQDAEAVKAPPGVIDAIDFVGALGGAGQEVLINAFQSRNASWFEPYAAAGILLGHESIDPRALLSTHASLLMSSGLQIAEKLAEDIARAVSAAWLVVSERRFALVLPNLNVPRIIDACKSDKKGWAKVAQIMLAASPAVELRLPGEVIELARRLNA